MSGLTLEIFLILGLLLANGLFAMAEIAVVASRKARLKTMIEEKPFGCLQYLGFHFFLLSFFSVCYTHSY